MRVFFFAGAVALCMAQSALADSRQPDDHAPLGVMGDHLHKQGEWMLSYKYKHIRSSGIKNGRDDVTAQAVMADYGETAIEMDMGMHMFEAMVGISDNLTLMVMPQYMTMSMTHFTTHGGGHMHTHEVSGFGDTEVTGLYSVYRSDRAKAHLNMGVSLPTGSTDETFVDHHDTTYRLPYNMQLGSGTFDPILGATITSDLKHFSWGAQTLNYLRVGKNAEGYRQGNKYTASTWVQRNLSPSASVAFRLEGEAWGNVSGRDASLPLNTIAGANPNEQAGERVLAHLGLNLMDGAEGSTLAGHRLAAEVGLPLYERYSGPQPKTDYRLTLGWQWSF